MPFPQSRYRVPFCEELFTSLLAKRNLNRTRSEAEKAALFPRCSLDKSILIFARITKKSSVFSCFGVRRILRERILREASHKIRRHIPYGKDFWRSISRNSPLKTGSIWVALGLPDITFHRRLSQIRLNLLGKAQFFKNLAPAKCRQDVAYIKDNIPYHGASPFFFCKYFFAKRL